MPLSPEDERTLRAVGMPDSAMVEFLADRSMTVTGPILANYLRAAGVEGRKKQRAQVQELLQHLPPITISFPKV